MMTKIGTNHLQTCSQKSRNLSMLREESKDKRLITNLLRDEDKNKWLIMRATQIWDTHMVNFLTRGQSPNKKW